MKFNIGFYNVE